MCGRELGFFERALKIENPQLGLSHRVLCSNCHREISLGIDQINEISQEVEKALITRFSKYPYASNDINILIFLTVQKIFEIKPDFANVHGLLLQIFYPDEKDTVKTPFDYLIEITYKVLRDRFTSVLGRYGLEALDNFIGYMSRTCLFFQQQKCNCGEKGAFVYADVFVCQAGFIFFDTKDNLIRNLFISKDRTVRFSETQEGATFDFNILKQRYHKTKVLPIICFNRRDQRSLLVKRVEEYNNQKRERINSELSALINNLNVSIEKDLREIHPNEILSNIPLDSIIVAIIKTLFEEDIDQEYVKEAPEGLLSLIVENFYQENFEKSGLAELSEIQDYILDECLFVHDFEAAFGNKEGMKPAFAFLTPNAYMIKYVDSDKAFIQTRFNRPNDLYCDYQYMIFEGKQEFYITTSSSEKNKEGYYFLTGVRINSKKKEPLRKLEGYFRSKALDYYQSEYEKEKRRKDNLQDKEFINAARNIFIGFGYLPFCIYDEWSAIEQSIRNSDILMHDLIAKREPRTGTNNARIFYTGKTVNSFEQQAAKAAENLGIKRLPIARALLWEVLLEEIQRVCSEEFIRLGGDIIKETDSLEEAFLKYSSLSSIQTEKAYYLGLFIYYLLSKGMFSSENFLDHYNEAVKMYIHLNPGNPNTIEFTELELPEKRPFDLDEYDFSNFNAEVKTRNIETGYNDDNLFIFSIRNSAEDIDSVDNLAKMLGDQSGNKVVLDSESLEYLTKIIRESEDTKIENIEEDTNLESNTNQEENS